MKPEDLKSDRVLRGPIFSEAVRVIVTAALGDAVKVVGPRLQSARVIEGKPAKEQAENEPRPNMGLSPA